MKTPFAFDYDQIPAGFYQDVIERGHPVRRAWHMQKFERVVELLGPGRALLDIGCAAGTFLSRVSAAQFPEQVGIDIDNKQVAYAAARFATPYRRFELAGDLSRYDGHFDCVTLIEVIEHLTPPQVADLLASVAKVLKPGGRLIMSTPNYLSAWPLLELIVNRVSEVSYEEQHITKLAYFSCVSKIRGLAPQFGSQFSLELKTTTHFAAPFVASISLPLSMKLSRMVDHQRWLNPFGALILLAFRRTFS